MGDDALLAKYGAPTTINYHVGAAGYNPFAHQTPGPSNFFQGVSHSVGNLIHAAGQVIPNIQDSLHNFGEGIQQGMPGGILQSQQKGYQSTIDTLDNLAKQSHTRYATGQITKEQYQKNLRTVQKGYQDLSAQTGKDVASTITPAQYLEGSATAGGLALAAGDVIGGIGVGLTPAAAPALEGTAAEATTQAPASLASKVVQSAKNVIGVGEHNPVAMTPGGLVRGALAAPIRYGLVEKPAVQLPLQAGQQVAEGHPGEALKTAGLLAATEIGARYAGKVAEGAGKLLFSSNGPLDKLKFSDGTINSVLNNLKLAADGGDQAAAKKFAKLEGTARQFQQRMIDEGKSPAEIKAFYQSGNKLEGQTVEDFLNQTATHAKAEKQYLELHAQGKLLDSQGNPLNVPEGHTIIASRWNTADRGALVEQLSTATSPQSQHDILTQAVASGQVPNNPNLIAEIRNSIDSGDINSIKQLHAANVTNVAPMQHPLEGKPMSEEFLNATGGPVKPTTRETIANTGYVPAIGPQSAANYRPVSETADLIQGNEAPLAPIGNAIRKVGLSPEAATPGEFQAHLLDNFRGNIEAANPDLTGNSGRIYNALKDYTATTSIVDPRLLTKGQIATALTRAHISPDNAGIVRQALDKAYRDLPLETQGLLPKVANEAMGRVPGLRASLRIQSYGRYSLNPVYKLKVAGKTEAIAQLEAKGEGASLGYGKASTDANNYVKSVAGPQVEGLDFLGGESPNVKPGLIGKFQQNRAANLVDSVLKAHGTTIDDMSPELKSQLDHSVQTIFGYAKGGYTDSNLAKSLNILVFPSRFDAKILGVAGRYMKSLDPITRGVLVADTAKLAGWSQSPEGKKWSQDNSELLGIAGYLTPGKTIADLAKTLAHPGDAHLSDLGEVGGLPFGVVTQILEHQGISLGKVGSSPYHDPKTGNLVSTKIPNTVKARAYQGLIDLVGSLYSYPGRTVGAYSKSDLTKAVVGAGTAGTLVPGKFEYTTKSVPGNKPTTSLQTRGTVGGQSLKSSPLQSPKINNAAPPVIKAKRARITTVAKELQIR